MLSRLRSFFRRAPPVPHRRALEAGLPSHRWHSLRGGDPKTAELHAPEAARRAGLVVLNSPLGSAIARAFESTLVGNGIVPRPGHPSEPWRDTLARRFDDWSAHCDADGLGDFYSLQRRAVRSLSVSGEAFLILSTDPQPTDHPLRLRLIPPNWVPQTYSMDLPDGVRVRQGIEFDALGRRTGYYVLNPEAPTATPVRLPALQVLHLFEPILPGQRRGITWLASALQAINDLSEASAGLQTTIKTAAMFSAFVTTPSDPSEFMQTEEERFAALEPGTLQYLHPGEAITFAEPPRVTEVYSEFYYRELCNIAASLGLTYESISADTSRSNYSSSRLAAINARRRAEALQFGVIIPQFLTPLWRRWVEIAIALGQIPGGDLAQSRGDFLRCAWHPPAWPAVDPAKEMTATLAALSAGLKSRTQAAAELGLDIETLDREIAADAARAARLGLSFGAPSVTPTPEE